MKGFAMLAFAAIAGCGGLPRPTAGVTDAELQGIAASVAKATGYPLDSIELTGSLNRIRFTLSDATLANAGQPEREQKAGSVVAAASASMMVSLGATLKNSSKLDCRSIFSRTAWLAAMLAKSEKS